MITFGTLASALSGPSKAVSILGMLGFWRLFLGIGIGGDYPLSGVVTSEFAQTEVRGMMIAAVFAMQGVNIGRDQFVLYMLLFRSVFFLLPLSL